MIYLIKIVDIDNVLHGFLQIDDSFLSDFEELYKEYKKKVRERAMKEFLEMLWDSDIPHDWLEFDSPDKTITI